MNKLVVVFSSDDNYCIHLGVAMTSLLENNREFEEIVIYVFENKISKNNKMKLKEIANIYNREIRFIDFNSLIEKLGGSISNNISISYYARLFIATVLPKEINKAIYFDCDAIIQSDLSELWNIDISKYYVAGVEDTVPLKYKSAIGLNEKNKYINSGMLLINLEKWRTNNLEKQFIEFINKFNGCVPHNDQGTINGVCKDKILILHPKYNCNSNFYLFNKDEILEIYKLKDYYSDEELIYAKENPVFLHFTPAFTKRPWNTKCTHPKKELYAKYKKLTPWKDVGLEKDNRNWKIKLLSSLYYLLPNSVFIKLYKKI